MLNMDLLSVVTPPSIYQFDTYYSTSGSGGFDFGSSKGGSEFDTFPKFKTDRVSGDSLVILPVILVKDR